MPMIWNDVLETRYRSRWGWMLAYGLLWAVIGILALIEPIATGLATGLFLALVLLSGGLLGIIAGFSAKGWLSRWLDIMIGLLSLLLGSLIIWRPLLGALSLVWAVGFWLLLCGGLEIAEGVRTRLHRGWLIFIGAIDILLGAYLALAGPIDALLVLAIIVGFSFLMRGIALSLFALRLQGMSR